MNDNIFNHFKWDEIIKSPTADRLKIDNNPKDDLTIANLMYTLRCLDLLRGLWGQPITITSGYRSFELNRAVRGAKTSQHVNGEAADITTKGKKNNLELYNFIRDHFNYDQLICEKPDGKGNCGWVHVSFLNEYTANRREALIYINGKYTKDPNAKK